jgi:NAD-dependent deacetylase
MMNPAARLAEWVAGARSAVAFTGAGISTESGIPDFRSPGGIWARSQPVYFQDFLRSADARYEYWRQKSESHHQIVSAEPNDGHKVLARWESVGILRGVITQNIDGLHRLAGSRSVLELHGTARTVACLGCGARFDASPMVERFRADNAVPPCPACGGILKHATVSFGQTLPPAVLDEACAWTCECDLFLAIGSSLVVEPAASLPRLAKSRSARLVIITRDLTPQDGIADLIIHESIGQTLRLANQLLPCG